MFLSSNRENFSKSLLWVIAFLFPVGMGTVQHWSSGLFYAALAVSLLVLGRDWSCPEGLQRYIFIAFAFFFLASTLSLINAEDVSAGVRRLEKILFLLYSYPLYLSIRRLKIDLISPLLLGFVVAGPCMAFAAAYFVYFQMFRRADGFYSSIVFGSTAMLVAMMVLAGLYSGRLTGWYKYFGIFSFLCGSCAALLSGTRGTWIALPVAVLFLTICYFSWKKIFLLLCIVVSFYFVIMANDQARTRFNNIGVNYEKYQTGERLNTSVGVRLMLWQQAVVLWKENPVIGVGIGSFRYNVKKNIEEQRSRLRKSYSHAHNIFLDTLASTGLCGFGGLVVALFIMPAFCFLRSASVARLKPLDFISSGGLILLLSFAIFGLTEGWLIHSGLVATFSFVLIVFLSAASCDKFGDKPTSDCNVNTEIA